MPATNEPALAGVEPAAVTAALRRAQADGVVEPSAVDIRTARVPMFRGPPLEEPK